MDIREYKGNKVSVFLSNICGDDRNLPFLVINMGKEFFTYSPIIVSVKEKINKFRWARFIFLCESYCGKYQEYIGE